MFGIWKKLSAGAEEKEKRKYTILENQIFRQKLDEYLVQNYKEDLPRNVEQEFFDDQETLTKEASLSAGESLDLQILMEEVGVSFHERLFQLIDQKEMTDVEVYKRAGMDRKLFSKIRSNPAYHPRKNTVLALAIALKLDIEETKDLLARAEYAFSPSNKGDLIIKYFIEHAVYDLMALNFTLDEYEQETLG